MIVLDTSVVIDSFGWPKRSSAAVRKAIENGERLGIPTLVLYEWRRGPRLPQELEAQEALLPGDSALPFGPDEAAMAAEIYRSVSRARGREIDLAIAACAITRDAHLWTLNRPWPPHHLPPKGRFGTAEELPLPGADRASDRGESPGRKFCVISDEKCCRLPSIGGGAWILQLFGLYAPYSQ